MKKFTKSMIGIACAALLATTFAACGDNTPTPPPDGGDGSDVTE